MKKLMLVAALGWGVAASRATVFADSINGECFNEAVTDTVRDLAFAKDDIGTLILLSYGWHDAGAIGEWIKRDATFVQRKSFWIDEGATRTRLCSGVMTYHVPPHRDGKPFMGGLGYTQLAREYRWTYSASTDGASFLVNIVHKGDPSSPVQETEPNEQFVYGSLPPPDPNVLPQGQKVPGQGAPLFPSPAKPTSPLLPSSDGTTAARDQAKTSVPAATVNEKKGRPAQCLLEVKGVHYLGGPCIFTPLDKLGSFRITDVQGLNLVAQVNSSKKDEGKAVWNGPRGGNSPEKELGEAYRSGGCWTASDSEPGKYEDSRICAWSLKDSIYLSPSPRTDPSSIIYYGSRVGMYDEIASRQGLDTRNARIVTKPSKDGAVTFCREYSRDYSMKCIDDLLRDQTVSTLRGNCQDKTFSDANGNRYAFLGRTPKRNDGTMAEFSIRDLASGEILDGSSASGYDVRLGIYQALCPSSAPKRSE